MARKINASVSTNWRLTTQHLKLIDALIYHHGWKSRTDCIKKLIENEAKTIKKESVKEILSEIKEEVPVVKTKFNSGYVPKAGELPKHLESSVSQPEEEDFTLTKEEQLEMYEDYLASQTSEDDEYLVEKPKPVDDDIFN